MNHFIKMAALAAAILSPAAALAQQVSSILQVLDTKTGKVRTVKEFPYLIEAPNWTKDGKWLVFNSAGKIYRISPDGGEADLIDTGEVSGCNNDHVLSADGKSLAISAGTPLLPGSRIFTLPLEGGTPRLVTPASPSYLHGWSPDGRTLCYCAERNGNFDVYTIPCEGGEETRLTTAPGLDDGPEFSPNGKYIWFNSVRSGLMQIWRMKADGSRQRQMTFDKDLNSWFPHVSPNGKKVAFIAYHKGDLDPGEHLANKNVVLRVMTSRGRKLRTVHELFGGQGTINVNSWAPDSRHLAFVSYRLAKVSIFCDHIETMARQEGMPFVKAASILKDLGYAGADIRVFQNPDEIRILDSLGFAHACAITDIDYSKGDQRDLEDITLSFMEEKGFDRLLLVPGLVPDSFGKADRDKIRGRITAFCGRVKAKGFDVLVEDYDNPTSLCYNAELLDTLFSLSPELGMVFDTGNFLFCGQDAKENLTRFRSRVRHVHLKDRVSPSDMTCTPAGIGCIPITEIVRELTDSGYDGWFTIEQYGSKNMLEDCKTAFGAVIGAVKGQ